MKKWSINIENSVFVSSYYGDDTVGDGSKIKPYKTLNQAFINNNKIITLDSGKYTLESTNLYQDFSFYGEAGVTLVFTNKDQIKNKIYGITVISEVSSDVGHGELYDCLGLNLDIYNKSINTVNIEGNNFPKDDYLDLTNCVLNKSKFSKCNINTIYNITDSILINSDLNCIINLNSSSIIDYNIVVGPLNISIDGTNNQILTLSEIKELGYMLKSYDMEDIGLRTNLLGDDDDIQNKNDWKNLFNNPIDTTKDNYSEVDFSIKIDLYQRIYDNQINNHSKTTTEADTIAKAGVLKVMNSGQYNNYLGAYPMSLRIDGDTLWNNYKHFSANLEYYEGNIIMYDDTYPGMYESTEIPLGRQITVENSNIIHELLYDVEGVSQSRLSGDAYEEKDDLIEQRSIMVYELDFYQDPQSNNTGTWTGFKRFEVNAPLRIDDLNNGNQDLSFTEAKSKVIHNVTKFKIKFELRK